MPLRPRWFLLFVVLGLPVGSACSHADEAPVPSGGSGAAAGGGAGNGGSVSPGGTASAAGGTAASGGLAGLAGLGGASGNAGAGGSAGMLGGGGAGAGAGSCSGGDCTAVVGGLDGFVYRYPCAAGGGCKGMMCVDNELVATSEFTLVGDAARVYQVELRIRGVVESKNYAGGMRRSQTSLDPGPAGGDLWYEGGTVPDSSYGSYELHVAPKVDGSPNDYYLNARDGTDEHDATTWALDYRATVKVSGGGKIGFRAYDSNCDAIRNCGPKGTSPCTPRTLDLADAVPPANLTQPVRDANMTPGQWLHIDVTGVTPL